MGESCHIGHVDCLPNVTSECWASVYQEYKMNAYLSFPQDSDSGWLYTRFIMKAGSGRRTERLLAGKLASSPLPSALPRLYTGQWTLPTF